MLEQCKINAYMSCQSDEVENRTAQYLYELCADPHIVNDAKAINAVLNAAVDTLRSRGYNVCRPWGPGSGMSVACYECKTCTCPDSFCPIRNVLKHEEEQKKQVSKKAVMALIETDKKFISLLDGYIETAAYFPEDVLDAAVKSALKVVDANCSLLARCGMTDMARQFSADVNDPKEDLRGPLLFQKIQIWLLACYGALTEFIKEGK